MTLCNAKARQGGGGRGRGEEGEPESPLANFFQQLLNHSNSKQSVKEGKGKGEDGTQKKKLC